MARLVYRQQENGSYAVEWKGQDERGHSAASGIYFYKLVAGKETISRKRVLIRYSRSLLNGTAFEWICPTVFATMEREEMVRQLERH